MKRHLSLSQKFSLMLGSSGLFAIALTIFGLFFAVFAVNDVDWEATIHLAGDNAVGNGEITGVFETNTYINEEPVLGYEYVFHSPIGDLYWTSYAHGTYLDVGESVSVEYNPDRPYVHRIQGMTNSTSGMASILFLIPLMGGVLWLVINALKGLRTIDIVTHGIFTEGQFVEKKDTGVEINERRQYKYIYSYTKDDGSEGIASHRSTDNIRKQRCTVIYHSYKPDKAAIVDFLPWSMAKSLKNWQDS